MRDLSTTLRRGIAREVLASAPLQARLDGRQVLPGTPVPTDGLAPSFGPAAWPCLRYNLHIQPAQLLGILHSSSLPP